LAFQQAQLAADGLDSDAQTLRGARDAAFLGDDPEVVQVLVVEHGGRGFSGKSCFEKTRDFLHSAPFFSGIQLLYHRNVFSPTEFVMKRIVLFLVTNLAVMLVLSVVTSLLGVNRFLTANGLDLGSLLAFAAVIGFGGSFISLLISKPMAKWSTGARVITQPSSSTEVWLIDSVAKLADRAGLPMPEVAIYEGEPNAFATGASKSSSLVAVSTGLLQNMTREEAEAVLAHEVAHIANGDMVTLTLIQGVVNTFVIFISRVIGYLVDSFLRRNDSESSGPGIGYMVTSMICEVVFGILASIIVAWFSRQREFRADAGAAGLMGSAVPMQNALRRLGNLHTEPLPKNMAASGIAGGIGSLFATHPPLEARIAALSAR
jgi:heat shock protein HtpX